MEHILSKWRLIQNLFPSSQNLESSLRQSLEIEWAPWLIYSEFRQLVVVRVVNFLKTIDMGIVSPDLFFDELFSFLVPG